ncbi:tetratricopeptide repeat protein [Fulvivirga sediminis]|uniref:Tetratricopeptide repeat protein n=1 Tax=Fulvivirga sediminis TaxID=2803949 RepID=A0A937FB02_9BACT|nr:tetratricopeptide repeat protein [Fulvivirga sediminis]MBL3657529.1 tetratricopeptide repeat protein [Fulvivirga sediminis]
MNLAKYFIIFAGFLFFASCSENDITPAELPQDTESLETLLEKDIDPVTRLEAYDKLSYDYEAVDLDKTINVLEKQLKLAQDIENQEYQAKAYLGLGIMYEKKGLYSKAINSYLNSADLNQEVQNTKGIAHSFNNIGIVFLHIKGYEQAIPYFNKSVEFFRRCESQKYLSVAKSNLGICYLKLKELDIASSSFQEALTIQKDIDPSNSKRLAYLHNKIGEVHFKKGNYEKAVNQYEEALSLDITNDIKSNLYNNIGESLMHSGNLKLAQNWIEKSLQLENASPSDPQILVMRSNIQAELYQLQNKHSEALVILNEAIRIASKDTYNDVLLTSLDLISQSQRALALSNSSVEVKDIFRIEDLRKQQEQLKSEVVEQLDYNKLQVLLDMEIKNHYKEVKQSRINSQIAVYLKISGLAIAAILLILCCLLIFTYQKKKKYKQDHFIVQKIKNVLNE